jgi:hypothetical protein
VTATKLTPKQLLDRMRKTSAELLGYDLDNLTPAQSVRLDRAAAIRLELEIFSRASSRACPST